MLLATEQSEAIEKAMLLIVSCCHKGYYGSAIVKIEDGIIVRMVQERSLREPFDLGFIKNNIDKNKIHGL